MDYRDPLAGQERLLAEREAELARLRAKKTPRRKTSKQRRELEQRVAQLEQRLAKAPRERALTPREQAHVRHVHRVGVVFAVLGVGLAIGHVGYLVVTAAAWRESVSPLLLVFAGLSFAVGVLVVFAVRAEVRNRRANRIKPDEFSGSSDFS